MRIAPNEPREVEHDEQREVDHPTSPRGGRGRLRRYLVSVCVLYTVLTVVSSTLALISGQQTDTHAHLLMRLLFVLVGLGAFELVEALRARLSDVPYVVLAAGGMMVLLLAVVLIVWATGQTGVALHPDAYRDAVLNVTAVGVVLVAVGGGVDLWQRRR